MSAVPIIVCQTTNQSLAPVAAQVAVELLLPQCASLALCVRAYLILKASTFPAESNLFFSTGGEQHTVGTNEDWHYSVSTSGWHSTLKLQLTKAHTALDTLRTD